MTVSELIVQLKTMPHDSMVVVRGYEGGVNEVDRVTECNIEPFSIGAEWYYGLFERTSSANGQKAVYLNSTRDSISSR